jgi:3D (Asp-Asp-Asp) domain-containing protein
VVKNIIRKNITKKTIIIGTLFLILTTAMFTSIAMKHIKAESRIKQIIDKQEEIIKKQTMYLKNLNKEKEDLIIENENLNNQLNELRNKQKEVSRGIRGTNIGIFEATAYGGGGICADGHPAIPGVIAADTDILPFGTKVYIEFDDMSEYNGIYTVHDTGGAVNGNIIDIYMNDNWHEFGRRNCRVTIIE